MRDAVGGGGTGEPITITGAQSFDPADLGGDGKENDAQVGLAHDANPDTVWKTEGYNDRDITKLKDGVGLVIELGSVSDLGRLEIESPTNDWKAEIYVAESPQGSLDGWGDPVATTDGLSSGSHEIDLKGRSGGAVLIWILDRGDAAGRASAEIAEVRVRGT